ncbi:antibiotic biosynthesis monooxygenase [Arthrobacter yangruifuii]|uniref:Antibiotic biosynthesis monooxygenase n=1 Tax=Arthrobacter yangruifuii TaxID=2606616 RepID=A0A5N6MHL2_9MICC|nr:antibiotic biosynthesis monooxygenase family protein [Arthrobacter yangruifuii]KAD3633077.1 antibiotic biosynthesis monooxygenase [Arthrobacter yangruifuii]
MYVVVNTLEVGPETAEAFEKAFIDSMVNLEGVQGLGRSTLMRPEGKSKTYLSTMEFDSKESFFAWLKSDSFKASHSDDQAPGMQAPNAVASYTVIKDTAA